MSNLIMKKKKRIIVVAILLLLVISVFVWQRVMLSQAYEALHSDDIDRAVSFLKPIALIGNDNAQFLLGHIYAKWYGESKDFDTAIYWFRRAAVRWKSGDDFDKAAPAAYGVGYEYLSDALDYKGDNDTLYEFNRSEATKWLKWSAFKGYPKAAEKLREIAE